MIDQFMYNVSRMKLLFNFLENTQKRLKFVLTKVHVFGNNIRGGNSNE